MQMINSWWLWFPQRQQTLLLSSVVDLSSLKRFKIARAARGSEQRLTCLYSSRVIVPSLSVSCMLNKTAEKNTTVSLTAVRQLQIMSIMWSCDLFFKTHISVSPSWRSHAVHLSCSETGAWNGTWPPGTPQSQSRQPSPRHSDGSFYRNTQISVKCTGTNCLWYFENKSKYVYVLSLYLLSKKASMICARMGLHARSGISLKWSLLWA